MQLAPTHGTFLTSLGSDRVKLGEIVPKHFYSLDAMRRLAALSVVFWHWSIFFTYDTGPRALGKETYPLYPLFKPFYLGGWRAVDLFFCLSRFIFFWLYADKISEGKTTRREFFYLCLSRIYPLHLLTLLVVLVGQQILRGMYGSYFVYLCDLYHFCLQLTLVSHWGVLYNAYSFNGPSWAVSVEVFCYAVFFLVCSRRITREVQLILLVCASWILEVASFLDIGRGLFSFFIGALAFKTYRWMALRRPAPRTLLALTILTCLLWVLVPLAPQQWVCLDLIEIPRLEQILTWHGKNLLHIVILRAPVTLYELLLFLLTIVLLALWETWRGTLGRRMAFLGNISYSSYLLHFPLQMIFVALLPRAMQTSFFLSPLSLVFFFALLILLSIFSYQRFERPVQRLIRRWALP